MSDPARPSVDLRGKPLAMRSETLAELVDACVRALPAKRFGVLAGRDASSADEVYVMRRNLRDESAFVDRVFRSYGTFYDRKDRGFCFDPVELGDLERRLRRRGLRIVAIFHSHRCRDATPTRVDVDLHYSPGVYSVLVSVQDPVSPDVKVFTIVDGLAAAVPLRVIGADEARPSTSAIVG